MTKSKRIVILDTQIFDNNSEIKKMFKYYSEEFASLTSENIKHYLDAARKGLNFFKALLFEEIRRKDLRIAGLCQTRKLSVLAHDWNIEGEDKPLVDFVNENFNNIGFDQFISDIVEAQIQGQSVFQLSYEVSGYKYYLTEVKMLPNYLACYDKGIKILDLNRVDTHELRWQANSDNVKLPYFDIDPLYLFEVYSFDGNEDNGLMNGLIDSLIWGYFFKNYGLKDWSIYLERFATPGVIGKYDPLMSKPDRDALINAVKNFGNLFKAVIPNTATVDLLNDSNKLSSSDIYSNYVKYWNDEMSIRTLGQAMTTDTGQGGSYAKAIVGNYVRYDIKAGDLSLITRAVNQLIKKLLDINFASVSNYPKFSFTQEEDIDYKLKKADLLTKLAQLGLGISKEDAEVLFGATLVEKPDSFTPNPPAVEFSETNLIKKKNIDDYIAEILAEMKDNK
ncbi:MAG: DUF935 family protein [Bacteroidota bacterium]|nr:DUF935 family protein [Bacteroidota bacterium]